MSTMPDHVLEGGDVVPEEQEVGQIPGVQLGQRVSVQALCNQFILNVQEVLPNFHSTTYYIKFDQTYWANRSMSNGSDQSNHIGRGRGKLQIHGEKCLCSKNNNCTALVKHMSLIDTALVMKNSYIEFKI